MRGKGINEEFYQTQHMRSREEWTAIGVVGQSQEIYYKEDRGGSRGLQPIILKHNPVEEGRINVLATITPY